MERTYISDIAIGVYLLCISIPNIPTMVGATEILCSDVIRETIVAQSGHAEYISVAFDSATSLMLLAIASTIGLYLIMRPVDIVMYKIICEYKDKKKQNKSEQNKPEV